MKPLRTLSREDLKKLADDELRERLDTASARMSDRQGTRSKTYRRLRHIWSDTLNEMGERGLNAAKGASRAAD